ncbi:MAG: hypothetical protein JWQ18_2915 [Conexibacter sp.]|nr:hypothetical protein [Conexibacter sp.]
MSAVAGVTIRPALADDAGAVARLAALDSARVPEGPLLLAEIDGEPWAALTLEDGRPIADPFRPTAALVDLLRRRAAQLAAAREASVRPAGGRGAQWSSARA